MSEYCKCGIFHDTNMAPESITYTSTRPKRVNNALLFGSSSSLLLKKSLSVLFSSLHSAVVPCWWYFTCKALGSSNTSKSHLILYMLENVWNQFLTPCCRLLKLCCWNHSFVGSLHFPDLLMSQLNIDIAKYFLQWRKSTGMPYCYQFFHKT